MTAGHFRRMAKRRFIYDPHALPDSAELLNRTLTYPIPVILPDAQREFSFARI